MPDDDVPRINVPLLRKSLEHITAHPQEWDQNVWVRRTACGTACCLAGTALQIQGYEFEFAPTPRQAFWLADGRGIAEVAQVELGLTEDEATVMFGEVNSLRELWELAKIYTGGEIEIPEGL